MRIIALAVAAAVLGLPAMPASAAFDGAPKAERAQTWRGADGRIYCRRPNGSTGIVVGGRGGAGPMAGRGGARRDSGSTLGAAIGALLGTQSETRPVRRCR